MISVSIESAYIEEYFLIFKYKNEFSEREIKKIIDEKSSCVSNINSLIECLENERDMKKVEFELIYKNKLKPKNNLVVKDYSSDIKICDHYTRYSKNKGVTFGCLEIFIIIAAVVIAIVIYIALILGLIVTWFYSRKIWRKVDENLLDTL